MLNSPEINWFIYDENEFINTEDYYLGSFSCKQNIGIKVQVWNNRYGQIDVTNIESAKLIISFNNIEDSVLLNYCTITTDEKSNEKIEVIDGKGIVDIGKLYGTKNNGLTTKDNSLNYKNIFLSFSNLPFNLQTGLKNMYLDIQYV